MTRREIIQMALVTSIALAGIVLLGPAAWQTALQDVRAACQ